VGPCAGTMSWVCKLVGLVGLDEEKVTHVHLCCVSYYAE